MLREAYIANLEAKRKPNAEAIADFTEKELAEFICQYADANFKGIYVEQDHNYSSSTSTTAGSSASGSGLTTPTSSAPKCREETEGERKHVGKETEVIYRNPALRRQCIDKYGYQCQCCGMDFAEMYGEELGANFIEVHHLKLISTFEKDGVPENFLENLVPLCSNCHSMIHHIKDSEHTLMQRSICIEIKRLSLI